MNLTKTLVTFLAAFLLCSATAVAQGGQQQQQPLPDASEISDSELERFVNATDTVQVIQQQAQQQLQELVKEEGMTFKRFRMIMMSRQNPQMANQVEVTEEEDKTIKNIQPQLMKINNETRKKVMGAIQAKGLTLQRYQQIFRVARADSALMNRLRDVQQQMGEGGS